MSERAHNIASITFEPDPDGIKCTLRVRIVGGGEMILNGPDAIPAFYTISNHCSEQYYDERTVH